MQLMQSTLQTELLTIPSLDRIKMGKISTFPNNSPAFAELYLPIPISQPLFVPPAICHAYHLGDDSRNVLKTMGKRSYGKKQVELNLKAYLHRFCPNIYNSYRCSSNKFVPFYKITVDDSDNMRKWKTTEDPRKPISRLEKVHLPCFI